MSEKNGLSKAQISLYWRAFSAACSALGLSTKTECEKYRHDVMLEEAGKGSIKDLSKTADFDAVLARFRADAGNYSAASDAGGQDLKRMAYLIKVICLQLMQLKGGDPVEARAYLGGLLDQARIPNGRSLDDDGYWVDMSPAQAKSVFAMLDTHRRRLLRRWSSKSAFSPGIRYEVSGPIVMRAEVDRDYYASVPFRITWRH